MKGNIYLSTGEAQESLAKSLESDPRFLWARPVDTFEGQWLLVVEGMIDPDLYMTDVEIDELCMEYGAQGTYNMKQMIDECEKLDREAIANMRYQATIQAI